MDERIKRLEFIENKHEYWFVNSAGQRRQLHGVTGAIGKLCGKSFPDNVRVQAGTIYGHDVHKESELWIKEGKEPSTDAGKWIVGYLKQFGGENSARYIEAELLVSDFEATASCVDIAVHLADGKAVLFDIKTTSHFDREYCSLQLSCYKQMYEKCYGEEVVGMFVLATKSRRVFRILEQDRQKVNKVFEMNKEGGK